MIGEISFKMAENIEAKTISNESFWDFKGAVEYVDKWPLMGSPWGMLLLLTSYLFFVLHCGPKFMENRPPYKLRNVLLIYNAFQVIYSCYLCKLGLEAIFEGGLVESGCKLNDPAYRNRILTGHYFYFLAKLTEFLDTIFFVLRKKWNQISFLHVYHHTLMFVATWTTLKYEPTYSLVFLGTANAFVHIVMYGYYGLSAFPKLQKYLWWKKHITKLQLIQFLLIMIQVQWNFNVTECPTSYILLTLTWCHGFLFIYLFTDFYVKSYMKKRRENKEKQINQTINTNIENNTDNKNSTIFSDNIKRRIANETR